MKLRVVTGVGWTFHSNGAQKSMCLFFFPWLIYGEAASNVTLGTSHILWGHLDRVADDRTYWRTGSPWLMVLYVFVYLSGPGTAKWDGMWRWGHVGGVAIAEAADQEAGATLQSSGHITSDLLPRAELHILLKFYCQPGTSTHNTSLQGQLRFKPQCSYQHLFLFPEQSKWLMKTMIPHLHAHPW